MRARFSHTLQSLCRNHIARGESVSLAVYIHCIPIAIVAVKLITVTAICAALSHIHTLLRGADQRTVSINKTIFHHSWSVVMKSGRKRTRTRMSMRQPVQKIIRPILTERHILHGHGTVLRHVGQLAFVESHFSVHYRIL